MVSSFYRPLRRFCLQLLPVGGAIFTQNNIKSSESSDIFWINMAYKRSGPKCDVVNLKILRDLPT